MAEDWPQWLGPERDAVWRETGILTDVSGEAAKVVWRTPVGRGYSSPSVVRGRVFVTDFMLEEGSIRNLPSAREKVRGIERVLAMDAETGRLLWTHRYPVAYEASYPGGPRTSPVVAGGKVFTLGTDGHLFALSAASGDVIWSKTLKKDYGAATPFWGHSAHPLLFDDLLICMVGAKAGVVVAFDIHTGEERWSALSAEEPGYAPPAIADLAGRRTLLVWHPESLNALAPENGSLDWSIPRPPRAGMSVTAPLAIGRDIYISGIGTPPALIRVAEDGNSASIVWRGGPRKGITAGNGPPLAHRGILYGVDTQGRLIASSLATGEQLWSTYKATTGTRRQSYATAFLVRHEERFFIFNERGILILAELTEDGYSELSRRPLLEPTTETYGRTVIWSHPAFSG
ncbi:MAG: PQQ-binding-like beta-propeller repeat protein, partial [Verrucomicrobiota bacterium]